MNYLHTLIGVAALIFLAWCLSANKKQVNWLLVLKGISIQIIFAVLMFKTSFGFQMMAKINTVVSAMVRMSESGAKFVFGEGYTEHFVAFSVSSTIIFFSALMAVFFYFGVIQFIVRVMARVITKILPVSGAEALSACANVFVGQTEAPLVIKPYIEKMTKSELMAMQTGGMATISGGMLAVYVGIGADAGFLVAASLMAAPASLVIAKIMQPEMEKPLTVQPEKAAVYFKDANVFQAICRGAGDGLKLALNVLAMLIAFISLAALLNYLLSFLPMFSGEILTVERMLGWLFYPFAFLIGVDGQDVQAVSRLLGTKIFLNEFIAYMDLVSMKETLTERSYVLATFALCGFANFAAIGIQIGGIGSLVEKRKTDIARLSFRAMLGGAITTMMTATVAGMFF